MDILISFGFSMLAFVKQIASEGKPLVVQGSRRCTTLPLHSKLSA
jgi:hypothetical protein